MENLKVKSINYDDCKEWFLKKHYARRMPPPIIYCFGLYDADKLIGVCSYSITMATELRKKFSSGLLELSRLVIEDGYPKNTLSFFVAQTFKLFPTPLVLLSYADTSHGHHGYIYQATNWIYTGLSEKFMDYAVRGMEHLHNQTIMDMSKGQENRVEWLRNKFGDKLYMVERPRKHRYFYFIGNKRQKKAMMKEFPYESKPYPKGDNQRYDSSYQTTTQVKLF